jgi:23S rRNA pseudouridine1911/1915/1917 synthase
MTRPPNSFTVAAGEGGRLDLLLAARFPSVGRRRWGELFAAGWVEVDGRRARKGDRVTPGARVSLTGAPPAGDALAPDPAPDDPLDVLHVDPRVVAIAKPAGVPSHPLRAGERGTAANALVARFPECAAAGRDAREAGLVHRLDRGTSGVLVAARDAAAWRALRAGLSSGGADKRYLALVAGHADPGASDTPLCQRGRRAYLARPGDRGALPAETAWEPVSHAGGLTLVRAHATTGRMHQVRAHLAAAGHPLAGDPLYGGPDDVCDLPFLHAESIDLPHPDGGRLRVAAALPADRAALLARLGLRLD